MIVYYEVLLITNSMIHLILCKITARFFQIRLKAKRIILSLIMDSLFMYLYLLNIYNLEIIKYFIGYLMSAVLIDFFNKKALMFFVIYYLGNTILGGMYASYLAYNDRNLFFLVLFIFLTTMLLEIVNIFTHIRIKKDFNYEVRYQIEDCYYLKIGFLDTGNDLVEPKTNIPVVIINDKIPKSERRIAFETISGNDYLECYYCDNFNIKINDKWVKKEVYLAYKNISYQVLLNIMMF